MLFNDFLRALAEVVRATAWPSVVAVVAYVHRERISELLSRLREVMGAKFDPRPIQVASEPMTAAEVLQPLALGPAAGPPAALGALPQVLELVRTPRSVLPNTTF